MNIFGTESSAVDGRQQLWKELILVFATFFLPGFVLQGQATGSFDNPSYLVAVLLQSIPQTLLLLYIVQMDRKRNLEDFGFVPLSIRDLAYGIGICVITAAIVLPIHALLGSQSSGEIAPRFTNPALLPLLFVAVLAAAYREEAFFRCYALGSLRDLGVKPVWAVLASSVLFGLGHIYQGISGFVVAFTIGVLMSAILLYRSSLHALGIGHGLYNFLVLILGSDIFQTT